MRNLIRPGLLARLLLPLLIIPFLGIAPRPRLIAQSLETALAAANQNSPALAAENLSAVIDYFPWRTDLWELAARYASAGGDSQKALTYLEHLSALGPLSTPDLLALGDAHQAQGDLQSAIQAWQKALPDPEALNRLLALHHALGDYPGLIDDLKSKVSANPKDAQACYRLGVWLAATQPEAAPVYLAQAGELDTQLSGKALTIQNAIGAARLSDEPAYQFLSIGRVLASMDEWEAAGEAFRQAARARPDYADAWAYLGEARQHISSTSPDSALDDLQTAIKLDSSSIAANSLMGLYWQRQERYDLAFSYVNKAAGQEPQNPALQAQLGGIIASQGDIPAALAHFQAAAEINPQDPVYWRMLADFSVQRQIQVRDVALPAARQAVLLTPNDPASLDLMGQTLLLLNDHASAQRFLERAIAADQQYAPAYLHLGMVYLVLGDYPMAQKELELAKSLSPGTSLADQARRLINQYFP